MMSGKVENDFKNTMGSFNKSGFDLSPTVRDAAKRFKDETVSAADFVTGIAKHHNVEWSLPTILKPFCIQNSDYAE